MNFAACDAVSSSGGVVPLGDEPYVDLMNEAAQLLSEGAIPEDEQYHFEEQAEEFEEVADPEWLRSYR